MKFLTSVIVVVAVFSTAKAAFFAPELESMYTTVGQQFESGYTSYDYYFPDVSSYSYYFDSMKDTFAQSFPEGYPPNAGQKAAMDYILVTKNSYKDVFVNMKAASDNNKAWVKGNFTKYGATFQALVVDYDNGIKAADAEMQKRSECGENDRMSARMQMMIPSYTIFSSGYSSSLSTFQSLFSMVSMNLVTNLQTSFSMFLYDTDPLASVKIAEATTIYPNEKLFIAEINNLGETMIDLITKSLDAQIANGRNAIGNALNIAKTYQCSGY